MGGGNFLGEDLIREFLTVDGLRSVTEMDVTCPRHPTVKLKGEKPFGEMLRGMEGGLFDTKIFGPLTSGLESGALDRWGYLELPEPITYPLHLFLTKSRSERDQKEAVESFCRINGVDAGKIPAVRHVPVLPTRFRMPIKRNGELVSDEIERRGYAPLSEVCRHHAQAESVEKKAIVSGEIKRRVEDLFTLLIEALRDKTGLIRQHGLGRRVDRSARLVVTPNPSLQWDQAGIPTAVLVELMGDIVAPPGKASPCADISWLYPKDDPQALEQARVQIQSFLDSRPDFVVLLNRQPSLHRDSFQAFHPIALPPDAGDVIQLCPLSCAGFGADFDGDEMVIHVPMGDLAQKEAVKLLPSHNLFSQATGKLLAHFDQDFVMGTYWLGEEDAAGMHRAFLDLLPGDCCRGLIKAKRRISKGDSEKVLSHLCEKHRARVPEVIWSWMELAFRACSRVGVSFGYLELREIAAGLATEVGNLHPQDRSKNQNEALESLANSALQQIIQGGTDLAKPGLHFAAMSISGARGKLEQIRQIVAARGDLSPGVAGFTLDREKFYFSRSLVDGLSPDDAFWAAMNARSSMCDKKLGTGHAGALTRELVFALWPFKIVSRDCGAGTIPRSVVTCQVKGGSCAACYGLLPDGNEPPIGFPVGLIAAQSIGERGTQLSMQSFHAGTSQFSIRDVRRIFAVDIVPAAEADMVDDVERSSEPELDSEVDLGDEDDATLEAWDEPSTNLEGAVSVPGKNSAESEGSALIESGLEIIVEGDGCRLHLPTWAGFESRSELGRRILDELANRFVALGRVADWLSKTRKQFLVSADPWHLGCDAFEEMRDGHVPVSPQSFLEMTGIGKLAKAEAFSRYTKDCFLVWPDATAPLSILFDSRSRQAWVGNVMAQLANKQAKRLDAAALDRFRTVAKPRSTREKQKLLAASLDSLSFVEVLMKAALMANVGCSEVLAEYGERIKLCLVSRNHGLIPALEAGLSCDTGLFP